MLLILCLLFLAVCAALIGAGRGSRLEEEWDRQDALERRGRRE